MRKKHFTKNELRQKEALKELSRRDFLGNSLKYGASSLAMPLIVKGLFGETTAYAETARNGDPAYRVVQIHLPGGWGGAMIPRGANGNALTGNALGRYGVKPTIASEAGRIENLFGVQFFDRTINPGVVGELPDFIRGLKAKVNNPSNLSRIQAFSVANDGQDDNNTNPMSVHSLLSTAGYKGKLVDGVGLSRTETGMSNSTVIPQVRSTPFIAPDGQAIKDLVSYTPALAGQSKSMLDNFAIALRNIGAIQSPKLFQNTSKKDAIVAGINAAHDDNLKFTAPSAVNLDPLVGTAYTSLFQNIFNTTGNNADRPLSANDKGLLTFATGLKALLLGQINFLAYDMPFGYDYHGQIVADNGNQNPGTLRKDRMAGELIGAIMNLAFVESSDIVIVLTSDGACEGNPDHTAATVWTGDRGQQNLINVFVVNGKTAGAPMRIAGREQIGIMRGDTGTVDTTQLSGKGDIAAAAVVAANILALNGISQEDILKIFPAFNASSLIANHLVFRT